MAGGSPEQGSSNSIAVMDIRLELELDSLLKSQRRLAFWRTLTVLWLVLAAIAGATYGLQVLADLNLPVSRRGLLLSGLLGSFVIWVYTRFRTPDTVALASLVEGEHPQLNAALLAAIEQKADPKVGRYRFLQNEVINEAVQHGRSHSWQKKTKIRLFVMQLAHVGGLIVFVTAALLLPWAHQPSESKVVIRSGKGIDVEPGDTEIERGATLSVLVRFSKETSDRVIMVAESDGGITRRVPLAKSLDDPLFTGLLPQVQSDLTYRIEYGGGETKAFDVTVFDYPRLERSDAALEYPSYTGLDAKLIENTRRVTAVQGAKLSYDFYLNKPVTNAVLRSSSDLPDLVLSQDAENPNRLTADLVLDDNLKYELLLVDNAGRTNRVPPRFVINVQKNKAPNMAVIFPGGDLELTPLAEADMDITASDDFGVREYGLAFSKGGEEPVYVSLGGGAEAYQSITNSTQILMEDLGVQPNDLVTFYPWADDFDSDGSVRRSYGDMKFIEVRPFQQMFRDGSRQAQQQQQQQQQQEGQQGNSMEMAELQKEIINATWNLKRRESRTPVSNQFQEDVNVIKESQREVMTMLEERMAEAQEGGVGAEAMQMAETFMDRAVASLDEAFEEKSAGYLQNALGSEQGAYQALLKLAADEFDVTSGQQQGGGGGGGRNQAQLNELELSREDQRYETERQAQERRQENQQQRSMLNRLKELAERQKDLNQRLRELQAALEAAESKDEEEALRRQLKRLQEEQEELVADMDELSQNRQNSSDQQPSQSSQQANRDRLQELQETRDQALEAADQLSEGQVSQALASGRRAQENLEAMRDEAREQMSSQFSEAMSDLRNQSRELSSDQQALTEAMQSLEEEASRRLGDTDEQRRRRAEILSQLEEQSRDFSELMDQAGEIVEQAEETEPLLADRLYETIRGTDQEAVNQAFELAEAYTDRNFLPEASEYTDQIGDKFETLNEEIEAAAEMILGDDLDALRLAQTEVESLAQSLQQEIERFLPGNRGQAQESERDPQEGGRQPGEQGNRQQSSSEQSNQNNEANPGSDPQSQEGQVGQGEPQGAQEPRDGSNSNQEQQDSPGQGGGENGGGGGGQGAGGLQDRLANMLEALRNAGGPGGGGPLTGADYADWADRLRDVQELLDVPELRNEAIRIGELARETRSDFVRNDKEPQWDLAQLEILAPMLDLQREISREIQRRESPDSLVPIDREPVPKKFTELVRRYYEALSKTGASNEEAD